MNALNMTPPLLDTNGDLIPENDHAENAINKRLFYFGGIMMGIMMSIIVYFLGRVLAKQEQMIDSQAKFNTYIETNNQTVQYLRQDVKDLKDAQGQHSRESYEDRRQLNDRIKQIETFLDYKYKYHPTE